MELGQKKRVKGAGPDARRPRARTSARNEARQELFADILAEVVKQRPAVRMPRRTGDSWLSFASGPFGYWALSQIADGRLRVEAYLDCGDRERNKRLLDELAADREAWDARTGLSLCFERLDAKKASRIAVYRQLDLSEGADRVQRRAVVDWAARALVAMLDALNEPLRARAKELRAEAAGRPPEPLAIPAP